MKRPEFVLVLAILAVAAGLAGAQAPPQAPPLDAVAPGEADLLAAGLAVFERARFGLWTAEMDVSVGRDLLDRSEGLFVSLGDAAARDYLLARVELYRGRIEVSVGDERVARGYFETAMDLAEASLDRRESAEAYRVLADAGSSWMITKGLGGIIRMAPKVQDWSDRALELDAGNALALLISAQGQINAPRSAGGDPEAALRRLEAQHARDDLDDIERFWTRVSLAQAYRKIGDDAAADRWCALAAQIYPSNPMVEDCR